MELIKDTGIAATTRATAKRNSAGGAKGVGAASTTAAPAKHTGPPVCLGVAVDKPNATIRLGAEDAGGMSPSVVSTASLLVQSATGERLRRLSTSGTAPRALAMGEKSRRGGLTDRTTRFTTPAVAVTAATALPAGGLDLTAATGTAPIRAVAAAFATPSHARSDGEVLQPRWLPNGGAVDSRMGGRSEATATVTGSAGLVDSRGKQDMLHFFGNG